MLDNFIYNVAGTKSYGHIMIDANDWVETGMIHQVNLKGLVLPSAITKVLKVNEAPAYRPCPVKEGDTVALSAVGTRVAKLKTYQLPNDYHSYANVHLSQVLGVFENGEVNIDSFKPLYDKVVMKKFNTVSSEYIYLQNDSAAVYEVIKTGDGGFDEEWNRLPMNIKVGSVVLVRDNVTSKITLDGEEYYITDDKYVVGEFQDSDFDLKGLAVYDDNNIFEEYVEDTIEGSFLYRPIYNEDVDDISQLYNNRIFKLLLSNTLSEGVYIIDRSNLEYVKFKNKTYFVCKGTDNIMARKG